MYLFSASDSRKDENIIAHEDTSVTALVSVAVLMAVKALPCSGADKISLSAYILLSMGGFFLAFDSSLLAGFM